MNSNIISISHPTGRPSANVTWFSESIPLDIVSDSLAQPMGKGSVVRNTLTIKNLARNDLFRQLTCQATNTNLTKPITATLTIDLTCKEPCVGYAN